MVISPPDWRLLIRDETQILLDKSLIQRCGGKIKGVYFFNSKRHCIISKKQTAGKKAGKKNTLSFLPALR